MKIWKIFIKKDDEHTFEGAFENIDFFFLNL